MYEAIRKRIAENEVARAFHISQLLAKDYINNGLGGMKLNCNLRSLIHKTSGGEIFLHVSGIPVDIVPSNIHRTCGLDQLTVILFWNKNKIFPHVLRILNGISYWWTPNLQKFLQKQIYS